METSVQKSLPSISVFTYSYKSALPLTSSNPGSYPYSVPSPTSSANVNPIQLTSLPSMSSFFPSVRQPQSTLLSNGLSEEASWGLTKTNNVNFAALQKNCANNLASQATYLDNASNYWLVDKNKTGEESQPLAKTQRSLDQNSESCSLFDMLNFQPLAVSETASSDNDSGDYLLSLLNGSYQKHSHASSNSSSECGSGSDNGKTDNSTPPGSNSPESSSGNERKYNRHEGMASASSFNSFSGSCSSRTSSFFGEGYRNDAPSETGYPAFDGSSRANWHSSSGAEEQVVDDACQTQEDQMYLNQNDFSIPAFVKAQSDINFQMFPSEMAASTSGVHTDPGPQEMINGDTHNQLSINPELKQGDFGINDNDLETTNDDNEVADVMSGKLLVSRQRGKNNDHSYIALISKAILSSPEKRLLLADIYKYISDHNPNINNNKAAWRNTIRHNLSLNECFVKQVRLGKGRGHYWTIHPACMEDFERGNFRRRHARRRARKSTLEYENSYNNMIITGYPGLNNESNKGPAILQNMMGNGGSCVSHYPFDNVKTNPNLNHMSEGRVPQYSTTNGTDFMAMGNDFVPRVDLAPQENNGGFSYEFASHRNAAFQACNYNTNLATIGGHFLQAMETFLN